MTFTEVIVVFVGLMSGYWIVDVMFTPKDSKSQNKPANDKTKNEGQSSHSQYEGEKSDAPSNADYIPLSWFRILEISENATLEQIASAYKAKVRQYHPDKVAQMGAEIRDVADFKTKQINAAYSYAVDLRTR